MDINTIFKYALLMEIFRMMLVSLKQSDGRVRGV